MFHCFLLALMAVQNVYVAALVLGMMEMLKGTKP